MPLVEELKVPKVASHFPDSHSDLKSIVEVDDYLELAHFDFLEHLVEE